MVSGQALETATTMLTTATPPEARVLAAEAATLTPQDEQHR